MRVAYLDCFSGMSGDMFLGALVDAGVSPELLGKTVAALDVGARLEISRVDRSGITATKVDVFVHGEKEIPREEAWEPGEHGHPHSHSEHLHEHQRGHSHEQIHDEAHPHRSEILHHQGHEGSRRGSGSELREHSHSEEPSRTGVSAPHEHEHAHGRGLSEIREIILRAAISEGAKKTAVAIFEALGAAEAKIHNVDLESIHFHEVGAVDAIVDVVGAAVGAEALGVDEIVCSPVNVGGGMVKCAHGEFPVPAPATVELLKEAPVYSSGIQKELVTPTGAAIVKVLASRFGAFPAMKIEKSGYGAGRRDLPGHPNVVRLTIGEVTADVASLDAASRVSTLEHTIADTVTVLEANLDDMNPQVFGYVMDRLLEEGALDAFAMPVQMKKNRPGTLLTVLCKPEEAAKLTRLIFAETTTLGVRRRDEQRQTLARRWVTVATQWGEVRMKVASLNGTVTNYAPEYEDCRRIAAEQHVPLKAVMQEATQAYLRGESAKH
jgi:pyridinium-3,5-bisthiocarboxylic acid mononucleotide nickel chelatase